MPDKYEKASEKAIERFWKAQEQIFTETSETVSRAIKAQADLVYKATDVMTRGYLGVLNGTSGAMMYAYCGFLEGYSRAWEKGPNKTNKKKSSGKRAGKKA